MRTINWYFWILLILCGGYAWWKGGGPERAVAAILIVGVVLTHYAGTAWSQRWTNVETGVLAVDLAVLVGFAGVALCAERFWTLWLTALHLIGTTGHLVKMADPTLIRWGYAFILAIWSYPMLLLIAVGTWNHSKRLARFGADRSWSNFSVLSDPTRAVPRTG
jgi:hypothetical protein